MKLYINTKKLVVAVLAIAAISGCSKLEEKFGSSFTNAQTADALGASGTALPAERRVY
jgi:uncharacterized lipoprotein